MAEIARRAGVVRATVYVHFPTREALLEAAAEQAIAGAVEVIAAAEPERGDPAEALQRVLVAAWRNLERYEALVAISARLPEAELRRRHRPVLSLLQPLIERGQRAGAFRSELPAHWHLSMLLALTHAANSELRAGRLPADEIEAALVTTALGALGAGANRGKTRAASRAAREQ